MNFLEKCIARVLIVTLGLLISSSAFFGIAGAQGKITIIGAQDSCNANITCEPISATEYRCDTTLTTLTSAGGSVHQIPGGNASNDTSLSRVSSLLISKTFLAQKNTLYHSPDPYLYPFVRIIKIQV